MSRVAKAPVVVEGLDSPEVGRETRPKLPVGPGDALKRPGLVDKSDLYVLFRDRGAGRYPCLLHWIMLHGLTSGYSERHARRFGRVLVIGQPDGLLLDECDVSYVNAETANVLFGTLPSVQSFFGKENGL
jgi:hypothetical protein